LLNKISPKNDLSEEHVITILYN